MKSIAIILALFLAGIGVVAAAEQSSPTVPQCIIFEKTGFGGEHRHVFESIPDLTNSDGRFWNDQISSIAVISGNWTFLADPPVEAGVANPGVTLGPGIYPDLAKVGIPDNSISQIRLEMPTVTVVVVK